MRPLGREALVAPPLLWSEVRSSLHEQVWRRVISAELGRRALGRLSDMPVAPRSPAALGREAWLVADELGWAKTYDAEYVALARLLRSRLLTLDARLVRATERLGFVIGPDRL